ncbi:uncharacterized protein si:ch211-201h21.5 isoform X3 [Astyanax mexicanus]|uniref:uncharacterized protein si:ch211-201h21.5 isoform X3 n=1 Tax=Astyanax mexicanus TaxID=7994 RepID=UPI0020CAF00B|nr:uncharacterized protein si:ch211-201h21.5 isoform X3 [Astyanax mexicanus]
MGEKLMIIDTDCGIDDAQAIMLALAAPSVRVLGLTCCFGNTDVENVCQNVLRVLTVCQRTQVSLVALGPLTNLALAVRLDPTFPQKLKNLYIMGGNMEGKGNVTPSAEFNFIMDPESAYIVLEEYQCPTSIATWEFTCRNKLTWEFFDELVGQDSAPARFMKRVTSRCWAFSRDAGVGMKEAFFGPGFVPYDAYAMAACVDGSVVTGQQEYAVRVELLGELGRGFMALDPTNKLKKSHRVSVMTSCDLSRFKSMLMRSLQQP